MSSFRNGLQTFILTAISCLMSLTLFTSCSDDDPTQPSSQFVCDQFDGTQLSTLVWAGPSDPARDGMWTSTTDIVVGESPEPMPGSYAVLPMADSLQPSGDFVFIVDVVVEEFQQDLNGGRLLLIQDASDFYMVAIDPESGEFRVDLVQESGSSEVVPPTNSRCVSGRPEDTLEVRLTRDDELITLYVNGQQLAVFQETTFDDPLTPALAASGSATFSSACLYTDVVPDLEPVSCELTSDLCDGFGGADVKYWVWSSGSDNTGTWTAEDDDLFGRWPVDSDNMNNAVFPLADSIQPDGDFAFIVDQRVELFNQDFNGGSIKLWNSFQNFYRIIVDPEQEEFWIDAIVNGTRMEVVTQTVSPEIGTEVGQLNEIRLDRNGGVYSLYINGDNVADFEDTHFGGDVDLALGALGQARFDRVCIFTEFIPEL